MNDTCEQVSVFLNSVIRFFRNCSENFITVCAKTTKNWERGSFHHFLPPALCSFTTTILQSSGNPSTTRQRNQPEWIQHFFLRFPAYKSGCPMNVRDHDYTPIAAKYYPLATRRLADEAIFLLKILNGFVDCPQLLNVINFHTASYFSRSSYTTLCPSPAHLATQILQPVCAS